MLTLICSAGLASADIVAIDPVGFQACMQSAARQGQLQTFDTRNIEAIFRTAPEVAIPPAVEQVMRRLAAASPAWAGRKLQLRAYRGPGLNAHAADHGVILVSASAWLGERPLENDELAAMLAHELAHLEAQDAQRAGCEALLLAGTEKLTLSQAIDTVGQESFGSDTSLAQTLRMHNQRRELAADARGAQLLQRAGFNPRAMVRLLRKLEPASTAFTSGSHPGVSERILHVTESLQPAPAAMVSLAN